MTKTLREKALEILKHPELYDALDIHNSLIDLRRNALLGDDLVLSKYLDFDNDMVVSAALYGLVNVFDKGEALLDRIITFAQGDSRDSDEMPIQTQAVEAIAVLAKVKPKLIQVLTQVARNEATAAAPRARAWRCLADLVGIDWKREWTESMIWDPNGDEAIAIRNRIEHSILQSNIQA